MKNKTVVLFLIIVTLSLAGIAYASSPPNYGLPYGEPVTAIGDLTAAGIGYGEEYAIVVKTEHQTVNKTPGFNQTTSSPVIEVMGVNIYNHAKGIVSGDRGYILVPLEKSVVKHWANYYNGSPDHVWSSINNSTAERYVKARYEIVDIFGNRTQWVNLAEIRNSSGGGGTNPQPTGYHSNTQWGHYNSGNLAGFDFTKAVTKNVSRITNWPAVHNFELSTGEQLTEQSSLIFNLSTYGVYDKNMSANIFLNGRIGPTQGWVVQGTKDESTYEIRLQNTISVNDLPQSFMDRVRANENGNDKNTLKLVLTDGYGRTVEQEIEFVYKPMVDIYVIGEISADPERKQFEGQDIPVEVIVKGTVVGLPQEDVSHWVFTAKKQEDNWNRQEIKTGSVTSQETTFQFLIPKSMMNNVDEYVQKFETLVRHWDVRLCENISPFLAKQHLYHP